MDRKDMDFARIWARRYISEHHPHGLDASDVENMILRRLHYNKDKGERGRKAALASALNEAQNAGRRNFRALVPWQVKRGVPLGVLARDMHAVASRQRVRERDRLAVRLTVARLSPEDRRTLHGAAELEEGRGKAGHCDVDVQAPRPAGIRLSLQGGMGG